jgi:hypothetical protein
VKQLRRTSNRQLALPLDHEVMIRLDKYARQEMIRTLADLLLEALGQAPSQPEEVQNESED